MKTITAAIVTFDRPFFTYSKEGLKQLPFNVEQKSETTTTLLVGDSFFEADTIEEVIAEFDRLGFVMPEDNTWDFLEEPLRISFLSDELLDLMAAINGLSDFIDVVKETSIKRNGRRYIYLNELYPAHEQLFLNSPICKSYLKEDRP